MLALSPILHIDIKSSRRAAALSAPQSFASCRAVIVFLHETISKLGAVKFSLIDSPAKKNEKK